MRVPTAGLLAVALLASPGCGGGGSEAPRRATGPAAELGALVQTFEGALARRDFDLVCTGLFAAEVRKQAGGEDCPALLERTAPADLRDPRITIRRIEVRGERATVQVLSSAGGQGRVPDTLEFVRQDGQWRIASLTS